MDVSKFSSVSPGQIVAIERGEHAFVPNPLPPNWQVPSDIWPLVVEANRQLAILEGIGRYLPNPGILLRPLEDREAIQSSKIEGTFATARELLLFEMVSRETTAGSPKTNEWREVYNYRLALTKGSASPLPLSLRLIRDLHHTLLSDVRGRDRTPGEFRRVQVAVGEVGDYRFIPPPAHLMNDCLNDFEQYLHREPRQYDSLIECYLIHYQFETIHPFLDGNGRVGRVLLALSIQQLCQLTKPWLYMSDFFAERRNEYSDRLFSVSADGDWGGWIRFCLEGTIDQCKDTVNRCNRLLELKADFAARLATITGSIRLSQIVEMVFNSPFVGLAELASKLGVHYQTAQADAEKLVALGILRDLPNFRPRTYYAPDVYGVAYEDLGDINE